MECTTANLVVVRWYPGSGTDRYKVAITELRPAPARPSTKTRTVAAWSAPGGQKQSLTADGALGREYSATVTSINTTPEPDVESAPAQSAGRATCNGIETRCQADGALTTTWARDPRATRYRLPITATDASNHKTTLPDITVTPPAPPTSTITKTYNNTQPGNRYEVRVSAQIRGAWRVHYPLAADTCEAAVPPAPTAVTASCANGVLTMSWRASAQENPQNRATSYQPRIFTRDAVSGSWVQSANWTGNYNRTDPDEELFTMTLPGTGEPALPDEPLQARVKATNTAGDSAYSQPADATCGPPGPITGLKCTAITKDQITIEWNQAIGANTYGVTGRSGSGRGAHIVYGDQGAGDFTTDVVSDLRDDASYVLTVVATNTEGTSRALVRCRTLDDNWLSAECAGDGILDINWNIPPDNAQTYTITVVASDAIQPSSRTNTLASSTTRWTILADPEGEYQVSVMSRNRFGGPIYSQTKAVECPKLSTPEKTWLSVSPNFGRTIPGLSAEFTYAPELHLVTNVSEQARNCSKTGNTWICKEHWTERDLVVEVKEEWLELLRVYGVEILETEGLTGIERELISTVLDASLGAVIAIIGKSKEVQKLLAKLKLDSNGVTKVVLGVVRRLSPGDFITGLFAEGIAYLEIPAPGCLPGVNDWTYEKNVAHKTSRSVGELTVERRYTFHYCVENES